MRARDHGLRLAAAVVVLLSVAGCELAVPLREDETAAPAAKPAGDSWIIVERGDPPPDKPAPLPAVPLQEELPEVLHLPEPVHAEVAEHLDPRCVGNITPGDIAPLTVDPGATTATVRWYHPGDPHVLTYRVTSISQKLVVGRQPELRWQQVEPGEGCHTLTATVKGLQRDTPYVFSVDVVRLATWQNTTRTATVARSGVVATR